MCKEEILVDNMAQILAEMNNNMQKISIITEGQSSSSQEVLANVESQNGQIQVMNESAEKLHGLSKKLNVLANMDS